MKLTTKFTILFLILFLGSSVQATIVPFSDNVGDYSSPARSSGFPHDLGVVKTFNFEVGDVLAATISGTWGNAAFSASSSGADIYLDNILVAQCIEFASCWLNSTGTQSWSYTFSSSDLLTGILDDGMAELRVVQTSSTNVRLGALTLSGRVKKVPEPASLLLIGLGLIGLRLTRS
ncbi:MAG: PEP-CTERM sorting domain-containing protein [Gammaproteobacteria bacterium]|nr:PEP-CTERM sorting domain-containing protein [Gammaproteobacteria bacterium]